MRPLVADVVTALTYLASQTYDPQIHPVQNCQKSPSSYRPKVNDNVENLSYDSEQQKTMMGDQLELVIEYVQVVLPDYQFWITS